MSRNLRWPTLEDAILAQYFKLREQVRGVDGFLNCSDLDFNRMARRMAEHLWVAACDPYEFREPREFWHFYNPQTNQLFKAYLFDGKGVLPSQWVWDNTEFNLSDWPILEFHHDVYLNTVETSSSSGPHRRNWPAGSPASWGTTV